MSEQFLQDVNKKKIEHAPLNPEHIPYYLLNFEGIVRGVIDETDDKDNTKEEQVKALLNQSKKKSFFMSKRIIIQTCKA